jgi:hypothetical protein
MPHHSIAQYRLGVRDAGVFSVSVLVGTMVVSMALTLVDAP